MQHYFASNLYTTVCTQSKLSLLFTKTILFPHKTANISNNSHNKDNNGDGNTKFIITRLCPSQLNFRKQLVIAKDEI